MTPFNPPLSPVEIQAAFPGRFAQLSALKSGGQGSVFRGTVGRGQAVPQGTQLALKIYYADHVVERTDREIAALTRIQSDFLVKLVGTGHINVRGLPCVWLETEFIEGEFELALILAHETGHRIGSIRDETTMRQALEGRKQLAAIRQ